MINVFGNGEVQVSQSPSTPYITSNTSNSLIGQMRYWTGRIEVYDGYSWVQVNQNTYVGLSPDAEEAIKWAMQKKAEEYRLKELADKYPAIKDLKEKLDIVISLVKEEENI